MVLAIGLLVDDAIVVVENVERIMHEEELEARAATRKSMDQITGALLGIALVLSAVFVPMAFFGGSTGVIYRQFSITIVSAMALSVLVALVLTPALCASMLRPQPTSPQPAGGGPARPGSTSALHAATTALPGRRRPLLPAPRRAASRSMRAAGRSSWRCCGGGCRPASCPQEDQGALMAQVQLPPGSTQEQRAWRA